jgi:hypothetical protein
MKIEDCRVGMKVKGSNMFNLTYTIIRVNLTTVRVEYVGGNQVMHGGKWHPERFEYTCRPSILAPIKEES